MKKYLFMMVCCLIFFKTFAQTQPNQPKLVVGIVIDQMRYDYLLRYSSKFGENGFKRLIKKGFNFTNAHYNYVPTETAPGHASIYTGATPAYHGVVGNDWFENDRIVYCVEDTAATIVGSDNVLAGSRSPRNLFASTLGDQIMLTTNKRGKSIGISIKDRGAILPAGHSGKAFWYDKKNGGFITSSYYMNELPTWAQKFNDEKNADKFLKQTWNTVFPIAQYTASLADDNPYEMILPTKDKATFPYNLEEISKKLNALPAPQKKISQYELLTYTPFGNTLTKDFAKRAIEAEQLGKDEFIDLLAISFSSTDIAGHSFGTHAVEIEDIYIRLDREIEDLLNYLDQQVGKGQYLMFLTADHGVCENPNFLKDSKMPSGFFDLQAMRDQLDEALNKQYGDGEWVLDGDSKQIYFNRTLISEKGVDLHKMQRFVSYFISNFEGVFNAYTAEEITHEQYSERIKRMIQMGYYPKRCGDVFMVLKPGWQPLGWAKGTTHGTPFNYDTHVPLLWYGWGIKEGRKSADNVFITDIVPTICSLLNMQFPNSTIGEPIEELVEED